MGVENQMRCLTEYSYQPRVAKNGDLIYEDINLDMETGKKIAMKRRDMLFTYNASTRGSCFVFEMLQVRTIANQICNRLRENGSGHFKQTMCDNPRCRDSGPCHAFACVLDVHNTNR